MVFLYCDSDTVVMQTKLPILGVISMLYCSVFRGKVEAGGEIRFALNISNSFSRSSIKILSFLDCVLWNHFGRSRTIFIMLSKNRFKTLKFRYVILDILLWLALVDSKWCQ